MIGDRELATRGRPGHLRYRWILFAAIACVWWCYGGTLDHRQESGGDVPGPTDESIPIPVAHLEPSAAISVYEEQIQPLLEEYCYACHGDGESEGGLKLDGFADHPSMLADHEIWTKVLKNVRAGVMPPSDMPRPTPRETRMLARWIKYGPFGIDPSDIDPGRVTAHRMNRAEYRNTIEQLLGVRFNTTDAFPPDAAGQGLDNIADLLAMSPLLFEKYLDAAESVLEGAFPSENARETKVLGGEIRGNFKMSGERISFNGSPTLTFTHRNTRPGLFRVALELEVVGLTAAEQAVVDGANASLLEQHRERKADSEAIQIEAPAKPKTTCNLVASIQSGESEEQVIVDEVFSSEPRKVELILDQLWTVEPHTFNFNIVVLEETEAEKKERLTQSFRKLQPKFPAPHIEIKELTITPIRPEATRRYFAGDEPPADPDELRQYVRQGVASFGLRAFRRPLDQRTLDRLTSEILAAYAETSRFNDSLKPSLTKLLCSPRFLFRVDRPVADHESDRWAFIDEYSLASRLSYFLWSSAPDDELLGLAGKRQLRDHLLAQVDRMLADPQVQNFVENFSGQWLQTRNVMNWQIVETAVLAREGIKESESPLLTETVRRAMRDETTMFFAHVVREDRSVLDFIDSDYSFLNAELADYYQIPGVSGSEMQLVALSKDSPRGGVLTQGSSLLVTSHANRTSPTKRGLFVLDTFLGIRPNDPPPNTPGIEEAVASLTDRDPTFRETLDLHASNAICASCHKLMDPIGFGLDNFNAIGRFRETEYGQPLDASGTLASGEQFRGAKELKQILKTRHRESFYRCLTEKLMTYALGRGLEHYDTESVDRIVDRLEEDGGRFSSLMMGIIESAPFQKRRND